MVFDFLKKRESETPPDVGKEDEYERRKRKESEIKASGSEKKRDELGEEGEKLINQMESGKTPANGSDIFNASNEKTRFEFEKIYAKIEAMNSLLKGFNERFSNVNQQIGEIRAMTLNNEKAISKSDQDALKAVDIVKEVQPDKLRMDFQRLDLKINSIDEKLTANKQYAESLMEEFKEIKRKAGVFEGGETMLKLNEEVKKDLFELQKMSAKVKLNADKSEQIFFEIRKGFLENLRMNGVINNLDLNYSGIKKEIEKFKIDYSKIVNLDEFSEFKKDIGRKFALADKAFYDIEKIKEANEGLGNFVEKILAIEKKNEEDIADIGMAIGNNRIKKVSDYENKINALLDILEEVSTQIGSIKKKIGYTEEKHVPEEKQMIVNIPAVSEKSSIDIHEKMNELGFSSEKIPLEKPMPRSPAIESFPLKKLEIQADEKEEIIKPKVIADNKPIEQNLLEKSFINNLNKVAINKGFSIYPIPTEADTIKGIGHIKRASKISRINLRIKFEHEMNDLLLEGGRCLVSGNFENAFKIYEEIRLLYDPGYDCKRIVYFKIIKFYENLIKLSKSAPITFQKTY